MAAAGYILLGSAVPSNILLYAGDNLSTPLKVAVILEVVHLVVNFIISCNAAGQAFEEIFNLPRGKKFLYYLDLSTIIVCNTFTVISNVKFSKIREGRKKDALNN